jgi:DNA polymerase III delta prime subunit
MRDKITNFVALTPWGKQRVVICDESDYLSVNSQAILRGLMEQYLTSRFILTANYPHRIIPAIHSRTQSLVINKLPIDDFTVRMAEILVAENIDFELDVLDDYVRGCWPDLRNLINTCQQNSIDRKLLKPTNIDSTSDYKIDAVELFKNGKFREARALVCSQIKQEDGDDFFRFLYNNLDFFGKTSEQKDSAILIIRKGLVQIPLVADIEILISAVITELMNIK